VRSFTVCAELPVVARPTDDAGCQSVTNTKQNNAVVLISTITASYAHVRRTFECTIAHVLAFMLCYIHTTTTHQIKKIYRTHTTTHTQRNDTDRVDTQLTNDDALNQSQQRRTKNEDANAEAPLTVDEKNLSLERKLEALRFELVQSQNKAASARGAVNDKRETLMHLKKDFAEEKHRTAQIAADMTRQYKAKREEYGKRMNELQDEIYAIRDKLENAKIESAAMARKKAQLISLKDAEITEQKNKMEEMAHEFGNMLKGTLSKMAEKVVISNDWEATASKV
jgi:hypothetical protein